jgi:twitching motility protein PilT
LVIVPNLSELLTYLGARGVQELMLQSGARPAVRLGNEARAVAKETLTTPEIEALFASTSVAELLVRQEAWTKTHPVRIEGRDYLARVARREQQLQVRLALAPGNRAGDVRLDGTSRAAAESSGIEIDASEAPARDRRAGVDRAAAPASGHTPEDVLRALLLRARQSGASDLHVAGACVPQRRLGGRLFAAGDRQPREAVDRMLMPLLGERERAALSERGYADFAVDIDGPGRLRVNISRQRTGLKGCFRLVAAEPPSLDRLGLPQELTRVTEHHQGLVIVAGPSGHGKTTTMAAFIDLFNASRPVHIIRVEDPVEVVHPIKRAVVTQREVGNHTTSMQAALKAALREDPDVIAIGELRDRETVEVALSAAETGHLVFATMSTPSGAKTIDRLIDMFPPEDQPQVRATLAGALKIVVCQRLVPTITEGQRAAAAEMITGGIPLWTMIRDNKLVQLPSLMQRGRAMGMIRLEDSLSALVQRGEISLETARLYADDPRQVSAGQSNGAAPAALQAAAPAGFMGRLGRKS